MCNNCDDFLSQDKADVKRPYGILAKMPWNDCKDNVE